MEGNLPAKATRQTDENRLTHHRTVTTTRRIFAYWLLLLMAASGVGIGAWWFLQREESRLLVRTESAEAARRAAVEARAALVAENVELLVGDVRSGLLDTLAEFPEEHLAEALDAWERGNPLVRTAFVATSAGRLLRPEANGSDDEKRGFVRRFSTLFRTQSPWRQPEPALDRMDVDAELARRSSNVASVQRARREVQVLSQNKLYAAASERAVPSSRSLSVDADAVPSASSSAAPTRSGWWPATVDGRLHLLGWVWPDGAARVRGVEVELAALLSRLASALPQEAGVGEGYVLRDEKGRTIHQSGVVPIQSLDTAVTRLPLAQDLLPGWEVRAFIEAGEVTSSPISFFWLGALLAVALVLAIVTSGSLLLWQARRSEAEAAQKTSFVANVSHEFKTPLTTIRLYAELLEQGRVADAAKKAEYLRIIGRETQRLARLVNNALDFSRLEQGRKKYRREQCDLGAELGRLLDAQMPRLADAGMNLTRVLPAGSLEVAIDRDALEQILLNLIENACKYAATGGEVEVTARAVEKGGVEVRVGDRGPGVPASERKRIFEKFHRVDETLTAEKSGTGLGLGIARQLARGMGGDLHCEARPGGGAVFVLTLP